VAVAGKTQAQVEPIGFQEEAQVVAQAATEAQARRTDCMGLVVVVVVAAQLLGQETEARAENTEEAAGVGAAEPRPAGRAGRAAQDTQLSSLISDAGLRNYRRAVHHEYHSVGRHDAVDPA